MAQPLVSSMNMNGRKPSITKEHPAPLCDKSEKVPPQQPNVRHIPIFVEGRDEPLLSKNYEHSPSEAINACTQQQMPSISNDLPKSSSIFSRVKDIPVRKIIPDLQTVPNAARAASPSRTIPINVVHTTSQKDCEASQHQSQPDSIPTAAHQKPQPDAKSQPDLKSQPSLAQQSLDAISKIQKIQHEVLSLMNKVDQYRGGSRRDKDYVYLDEMLTQNLLKLDTIDAEGKENIKAARKEAINCINKCIAVLEAKTDSSTCAQTSVTAGNSLQQTEIS